MPWKVEDVMEQRLRFVIESRKKADSFSELCRQFEITRQTGYKWLGRYQAQGLEGLRDHSRAPRDHPNEVMEPVERQILGLRAKYPLWGARKIRAHLINNGCVGIVPACSTIGIILNEHGLTVPQKRRIRTSRGGEPLAHADGPNRVWCTDFKGWFRTADGVRCDPLTITDAHSRYLLRCQIVKAEDTLHAKPVLEAAFREFGLPERLRTDNGAPFGSNGDTGLSALAVWWIKLGIYPERIRPGKPQENGRHERMHLTLKQATASPPARNRREQQRRFDEFRREYNEVRPHEALGQVPPATVYTASAREWPRQLPKVEYGPDQEVRWVDAGGRTRWHGTRIFISHALAGEPVGLEQIGPEAWRVTFNFYELGVAEEHRTRLWTPTEWRKREGQGDG